MSQLRPSHAVSFESFGRPRRALAEASLVAALAAAPGCGTGYATGATNAKPMVYSEAERDLDCPQKDIRVTEALGGVFEAVGCGRTARYRAICEGVKCSVSSEADPLPGWKDRPAPGDPTR
jgi:hypothetical protein